MSRIIDKLVKASGGWETFLYQTLKEVCDELRPAGYDAGVGGIVDEARDVLKAYEEMNRRGQPDVIVSTPRVTPTPVINTLKMESVEVGPDEDVEWKLEDLVLAPGPRPPANSRTQTGRVNVDKDLGSSSGELPMPTDHKLVNRQNLSINTLEGMVLGTPSAKNGEEGQIQSQYVSGHVSVTGRYRLVFVDTKLGAAHIQYEVVALPTKVTSKQYEVAVAAANKLTVAELQERLKHFGMVYIPCLCGQEDCFGWRIVDKAEVEEVMTQRDTRIAASKNLSLPSAPSTGEIMTGFNGVN